MCEWRPESGTEIGGGKRKEPAEVVFGITIFWWGWVSRIPQRSSLIEEENEVGL